MRSLAGRLSSLVRQLRHSEKAQGLVEYALIVAIVSLGAIASLTFFRDNITGLFSKTGNNLSSSTSPPPAPVITSGPTQPETQARGATFAWTTEFTDFVECKLDAAAWGVCPDTGAQYTGPLSVAPHQFKVRATNDFGVSPEANWDWTILGSPPPAGTSVTLPSGPPFNTPVTYFYYPAGQVNGVIGPDGLEGFYTLIALPTNPPTSFTVDGWTFNCTWHLGLWTAPGHLFVSACVNVPVPTGGTASLAPNPAQDPVMLGTQLTATTSGWSGGPTSYEYRWERNNNIDCSTGTWTTWDTNNTSSTSNSNTPTTAADGDRCYRVVVTASNASNFGGDSAEVTTNTIAVHVPPPPTPGSTAFLVPGPVGSGSTLTAQTSGWTDTTSGLRYEYHWERNSGPDCSSGYSEYDTGGPTANTSDTNTGTQVNSTTGRCYRVRVRAYNIAGIWSAYTGYTTPVQVLPLPAAPTINSGPNNAGNDAAHTAPSFGFTAGANTTSLECRFDTGGSQGSWGACTSPKGYGPGLGVNSYQFNVRGTGPVGTGPASTRSFSVALPGAPNITGGPSGSGSTSTYTNPSFTFSAGSNSTGSECRLDTGGSQGTWTACTSPKSYGPGLALGSYQFNVRGTSPVGPGPADTQSWTVTNPSVFGRHQRGHLVDRELLPDQFVRQRLDDTHEQRDHTGRRHDAEEHHVQHRELQQQHHVHGHGRTDHERDVGRQRAHLQRSHRQHELHGHASIRA